MPSARGEPVDNVPRVVAAELLARLRYVHCEIRTNDAFDGFLDVLLQGLAREAADENVVRNVGVVEPMKGDGMTEAPRDDRVEKRKARLVDIGRGDVPVGQRPLWGASPCTATS